MHVRSMVPAHWAVLMRTDEMLHGAVMLGEDQLEGFAMPELDLVRKKCGRSDPQ